MQTSKRQSGGRSSVRSCCAGLRDLIPPRLFKALGDPNRVALVARLADCRGGCTVSEVASCCDVDLSVVSRHLAQLRDAGILDATRRGKQVFYTVRANALASALRTLAEALAGCAAGKCGNGRKGDDVGR